MTACTSDVKMRTDRSVVGGIQGGSASALCRIVRDVGKDC